MTIEAIWNDHIIARSGDTIMVEGNHYFPADDVESTLLVESDKTSFCPWKGTASYYSISADGETNPNAAWTYRDPLEKAEHIRDYLAFWNGVEVREV